MYRIDLTNRQKTMRLDRRSLRHVVQQLLTLEGVSSAEISIAFVDDAEMQVLNARHLEHDYPTDVLSFLLDDAEDEAGARYLEAEVIVSTETATREAPQFGWSPDDELTLYIVHGLLHACGYDDLNPREKARMRRREKAILVALGRPIPNRRRASPVARQRRS